MTHAWRLKAQDTHVQQHYCTRCQTIRTKVSLDMSSWPQVRYVTRAGLEFRNSAPPCEVIDG